MKKQQWHRRTLWILLATLLVGCGDGGEAVVKRRNVLGSLAKAYMDFGVVNQRSPSSTSELIEHMRAQPSASEEELEAASGLEEGDIVMNWDGDLSKTAENGLYVLGFEAGVPGSGGYVVMADGMVQLMTRQDFSEARMVPEVESE
ncbi:MAG: hypothetical protein AAGG48_20630 [Planctomycetota bacterium]